MPPFLKPNTAEVAAKDVDGEAVLINLTNGMYYSMDLVGGFVWSLIESGYDLAAIADAVFRRAELHSQEHRTARRKMQHPLDKCA